MPRRLFLLYDISSVAHFFRFPGDIPPPPPPPNWNAATANPFYGNRSVVFSRRPQHIHALNSVVSHDHEAFFDETSIREQIVSEE
jgi:hypothetical protein